MAKVIAVTGKGGTGKTTVAALIIRHLKEHARGPILALDADPDANLATVLGIKVEKTIGDLREETLSQIKNLPAGMSKSHYIQAALHEVVTEDEKVDLITMGRSEGPGCYCYINNLLRTFSDELQNSYEWVVMDNEAGLEHLSRRTASRVDHLIVVVNETPLSIDCAERIVTLTSSLDNPVRRRHVLINNVRCEARAEVLRERLRPLALEYAGTIPYDPAVEDFCFRGESLYKLGPGPAILKISEIMKAMGED